MAGFIDSDKYLRIAEDVLKASSGEIVEVGISHAIQDNARFMESTVHQYNKLNELKVSVRVRFGQKCGISSTTDTTKDGLINLVKQAEEIALNSKEDPFLPFPEGGKSLFFEQVDPAVADFGPAEKSRFLSRIFQEFSEDFLFYGSMRSSLNFVGVYNNLGLRAGMANTALHLTLLPEDPEETDTFWVQYSSPSLDTLKYDDIFVKLREFLKMRYPDAHIKPGKYPVILSPYAVREVLDFMQYVGFSGKALELDISFLKGMKGRKVFGDSFSLVDKPVRKSGFSMPFDFEGISKRNIVIFEKGVFRRFIFDKRTARIFNRKTTGHGLVLLGSFPFAGHLEMPPGEKTLSEMIAEYQDVIYIHRFHYVNVLDPRTFTLTGMTRDGTFRVKHGKRWARLPNMRFQVNFVDLFNNITAISKEHEEIGFPDSYDMDLPLSYRLPYLRCEGFNFIGFSTEEG